MKQRSLLPSPLLFCHRAPTVTLQVVLPLLLGQIARFTPLIKLHQYKSKIISRLSECVLLAIIYTTFCDTFGSRAGKNEIKRRADHSNSLSLPLEFLASMVEVERHHEIQ